MSTESAMDRSGGAYYKGDQSRGEYGGQALSMESEPDYSRCDYSRGGSNRGEYSVRYSDKQEMKVKDYCEQGEVGTESPYSGETDGSSAYNENYLSDSCSPVEYPGSEADLDITIDHTRPNWSHSFHGLDQQLDDLESSLAGRQRGFHSRQQPSGNNHPISRPESLSEKTVSAGDSSERKARQRVPDTVQSDLLQTEDRSECLRRQRSCELGQENKERSCDLGQNNKQRSCELGQENKERSRDLGQNNKQRSCELGQIRKKRLYDMSTIGGERLHSLGQMGRQRSYDQYQSCELAQTTRQQLYIDIPSLSASDSCVGRVSDAHIKRKPGPGFTGYPLSAESSQEIRGQCMDRKSSRDQSSGSDLYIGSSGDIPGNSSGSQTNLDKRQDREKRSNRRRSCNDILLERQRQVERQARARLNRRRSYNDIASRSRQSNSDPMLLKQRSFDALTEHMSWVERWEAFDMYHTASAEFLDVYEKHSSSTSIPASHHGSDWGSHRGSHGGSVDHLSSSSRTISCGGSDGHQDDTYSQSTLYESSPDILSPSKQFQNRAKNFSSKEQMKAASMVEISTCGDLGSTSGKGLTKTKKGLSGSTESEGFTKIKRVWSSSTFSDQGEIQLEGIQDVKRPAPRLICGLSLSRQDHIDYDDEDLPELSPDSAEDCNMSSVLRSSSQNYKGKHNKKESPVNPSEHLADKEVEFFSRRRHSSASSLTSCKGQDQKRRRTVHVPTHFHQHCVDSGIGSDTGSPLEPRSLELRTMEPRTQKHVLKQQSAHRGDDGSRHKTGVTHAPRSNQKRTSLSSLKEVGLQIGRSDTGSAFRRHRSLSQFDVPGASLRGSDQRFQWTHGPGIMGRVDSLPAMYFDNSRRTNLESNRHRLDTTGENTYTEVNSAGNYDNRSGEVDLGRSNTNKSGEADILGSGNLPSPVSVHDDQTTNYERNIGDINLTLQDENETCENSKADKMGIIEGENDEYLEERNRDLNPNHERTLHKNMEYVDTSDNAENMPDRIMPDEDIPDSDEYREKAPSPLDTPDKLEQINLETGHKSRHSLVQRSNESVRLDGVQDGMDTSQGCGLHDRRSGHCGKSRHRETETHPHSPSYVISKCNISRTLDDNTGASNQRNNVTHDDYNVIHCNYKTANVTHTNEIVTQYGYKAQNVTQSNLDNSDARSDGSCASTLGGIDQERDNSLYPDTGGLDQDRDSTSMHPETDIADQESEGTHQKTDTLVQVIGKIKHQGIHQVDQIRNRTSVHPGSDPLTEERDRASGHQVRDPIDQERGKSPSLHSVTDKVPGVSEVRRAQSGSRCTEYRIDSGEGTQGRRQEKSSSGREAWCKGETGQGREGDIVQACLQSETRAGGIDLQPDSHNSSSREWERRKPALNSSSSARSAASTCHTATDVDPGTDRTQKGTQSTSRVSPQTSRVGLSPLKPSLNLDRETAVDKETASQHNPNPSTSPVHSKTSSVSPLTSPLSTLTSPLSTLTDILTVSGDSVTGDDVNIDPSRQQLGGKGSPLFHPRPGDRCVHSIVSPTSGSESHSILQKESSVGCQKSGVSVGVTTRCLESVSSQTAGGFTNSGTHSNQESEPRCLKSVGSQTSIESNPLSNQPENHRNKCLESTGSQTCTDSKASSQSRAEAKCLERRGSQTNVDYDSHQIKGPNRCFGSVRPDCFSSTNESEVSVQTVGSHSYDSVPVNDPTLTRCVSKDVSYQDIGQQLAVTDQVNTQTVRSHTGELSSTLTSHAQRANSGNSHKHKGSSFSHQSLQRRSSRSEQVKVTEELSDFKDNSSLNEDQGHQKSTDPHLGNQSYADHQGSHLETGLAEQAHGNIRDRDNQSENCDRSKVDSCEKPNERYSGGKVNSQEKSNKRYRRESKGDQQNTYQDYREESVSCHSNKENINVNLGNPEDRVSNHKENSHRSYTKQQDKLHIEQGDTGHKGTEIKTDYRTDKYKYKEQHSANVKDPKHGSDLTQSDQGDRREVKNSERRRLPLDSDPTHRVDRDSVSTSQPSDRRNNHPSNRKPSQPSDRRYHQTPIIGQARESKHSGNNTESSRIEITDRGQTSQHKPGTTEEVKHYVNKTKPSRIETTDRSQTSQHTPGTTQEDKDFRNRGELSGILPSDKSPKYPGSPGDTDQSCGHFYKSKRRPSDIQLPDCLTQASRDKIPSTGHIDQSTPNQPGRQSDSYQISRPSERKDHSHQTVRPSERKDHSHQTVRPSERKDHSHQTVRPSERKDHSHQTVRPSERDQGGSFRQEHYHQNNSSTGKSDKHLDKQSHSNQQPNQLSKGSEEFGRKPVDFRSEQGDRQDYFPQQNNRSEEQIINNQQSIRPTKRPSKESDRQDGVQRSPSRTINPDSRPIDRQGEQTSIPVDKRGPVRQDKTRSPRDSHDQQTYRGVDRQHPVRQDKTQRPRDSHDQQTNRGVDRQHPVRQDKTQRPRDSQDQETNRAVDRQDQVSRDRTRKQQSRMDALEVQSHEDEVFYDDEPQGQLVPVNRHHDRGQGHSMNSGQRMYRQDHIISSVHDEHGRLVSHGVHGPHMTHGSHHTVRADVHVAAHVPQKTQTKRGQFAGVPAIHGHSKYKQKPKYPLSRVQYDSPVSSKDYLENSDSLYPMRENYGTHGSRDVAVLTSPDFLQASGPIRAPLAPRHEPGYASRSQVAKADGPVSLHDPVDSMSSQDGHSEAKTGASSNQMHSSSANHSQASHASTNHSHSAAANDTQVNGNVVEDRKNLKNLPIEEVLVKARAVVEELGRLEEYHRGEGMRLQKMLGDFYWDYTTQRQQIGDAIADAGYAEITIKMLKSLNTIGIFKNDDVWFPAYYTYNTTWNYSDTSDCLAKNLAEADAVRLLTLNCSHKPYLTNIHSKNVYYVMKASMSILHNIARNPNVKSFFKDNKTAEVVMPFINMNDDMLRVLAMLTLAYIVEEEDNSKLIDETGTIKNVVMWIGKALDNPKRRFKGFTPQELTQGLDKLAVNDGNKPKIVEEGSIELFMKMLTSDNDKEQSTTARCVWTLAFDKDVRQQLLDTENLMSTLEKLADSQVQDVKKNAQGALWVLSGKGDAPTDRPRSAPRGKNHVFISYSWNEQEKVMEIRDRLRAEGYVVWVDIEQMGGSTLQAMAEAVENAAVVLVCMSEKYKQSPNCRTEAEYTFQLRKDYIPLMMQKKYRPDGWLGMILGAKLFFDFSGKYPFEKSASGLLKELRGRGKRSNVLQGQSVDDVDALQAREDNQLVQAGNPHRNTHPGTEIALHPGHQPQAALMTRDDVQRWLVTQHLDRSIATFSQFDGRLLWQLREMKHEAPEYFYQCLERKLNLDLIDTLRLASALDTLH